ncbi:uncharacterized protein LOC107870281 isoform X2 [Capsicum annuum]|uniref:uncharacterized protein LOC107870281 isoform X2 n=1 Tax=Capsicum annuum TaxID=4072 RepID=UPI001FB15454|nr:uncharacterized protein LOC107870281 isoform X2 [Capsicum annuum]XP_047263387.1 uncharacterized protein LOC107870281 isoform X2 [Capsicum annuum]
MASSTRIFGKCCRALMAAAKTTSAATATVTVTKARGRPNGILKPQPVSPALANFIGTNEASRTDAVKKVWEYIKTHNLQLLVHKVGGLAENGAEHVLRDRLQECEGQGG